MPAFDPVRDAVMNSPVTQAKPLPPFRIDLPQNNFQNPSAPSTSSSEHLQPAPSPITRRATHLSVLLNDDPPPESLFTPTTPRTTNPFANILNADEPSPSIKEQLADATPLRRKSSILDPDESARTGSYFPPPSQSPLAFPGRRGSPLSTGHQIPPQSPGIALPGSSPSFPPRPTSRPTSAPFAFIPPPDRPAPDDHIMSLRRHSGGAMDLARDRDREGISAGTPGVSVPQPQPQPFTPTTRSPLALRGQSPHDSLFHSSPSPQTRSPGTPFGGLALPGTSGSAPHAPASPTHSTSLSRPSTAGSITGAGPSTSRPISPLSSKRKSISSGRMPPPPIPTPTQSAPMASAASSLPPKPPVIETSRGLSSLPPAPQSQPRMPLVSFRRSNVPYAPKYRKTPPTSVLIPLTHAELERYRNFEGGLGTQMLKRSKRKRGGEDLGDEERVTKRTRDVGLIAEHYNARPEVGITQRKDSPIIGLKNFNNWVKSVLISSQAHPVLVSSPNSGPYPGVAPRPGMRGPPRGSGKVLDMGCGKGGDLTKWVKAKIREYVGVDIAAVSVDQARNRYNDLRNPKFTAYFVALDCYVYSLSTALPSSILPPQAHEFDVVSMQFCMHYAFETEAKTRTMLSNVSTWLRKGGRFIGTVPNAAWLFERLDALPKNAKELKFGNDVYSIRFEQRDERPLYGHRYWFWLKDAVDNVPEYVVHWDNFVELAAEYELSPVYVKEFHEVFADNEDHSEYGPLLQHMRVVDANGESQMDEDQWEAANIYLAFAFEKQSSKR